jgi:hypothetical protein
MSNTPPNASKTPSARPEPPVAVSVQTRPRTQRVQERRRALIIISSGVLFVAIPAAVVMMIAAKSAILPNRAQTTSAMPDYDIHVAKITNDSDGKECSQQIFDNQTGRMVRSARPCEATTYDRNGAPVPVGTIHRLDAISKSFAGH